MLRSPPLRMTSLQANIAQPFYRELSQMLAHATGLDIDFFESDDWLQRSRLMESGEIQIGVFCGLHYTLQAALKTPYAHLIAAPVMSGELYRGQPHYYSHVLVNAHRGPHSDLTSWEQLRGVRWAFNEPRSHSGYNLLLHELALRGENSDFFGEFLESKSHENSLWALLQGEIDAAVVDTTVYELALRAQPAWARRFRIIQTLGPSMAPPLVVSAHLEADKARALQHGLLTLHQTLSGKSFLTRHRVARFVAVHDGDYDDIRHMHAKVRRHFPLAGDDRWPQICASLPRFQFDFKQLF